MTTHNKFVWLCAALAMTGCAAEVLTDESEKVASTEAGLWRGVAVHDTRVAMISSVAGSCTAIPIGTKFGQNFMMTSAHCFNNVSSPIAVDFFRSNGAGATVWLGTFTTHFRTNPGYNPNASGANLAAFDRQHARVLLSERVAPRYCGGDRGARVPSAARAASTFAGAGPSHVPVCATHQRFAGGLHVRALGQARGSSIATLGS